MPTFSATISGWYCQPMNCIGSAGAALAWRMKPGAAEGGGARDAALQHGTPA